MNPTPGRIVFYHFQDFSGSLDERPATITSVNDDGTVNLHVFFEPHDRPVCRPGDNDEMWRYWNFRDHVDACHADPLRPATLCTWSWPPRV
jgi:hypothetical protein